MSSNGTEQNREGEGWEGQEPSRKRHHSEQGDQHESGNNSMENKQRRLTADGEIQEAHSGKSEQLREAVSTMEPIAQFPASQPPMMDPSNNLGLPSSLAQLGGGSSANDNQSIPMANHLFAGQMAMGIQMAGMGMQTNPMFQQQFFLANRTYAPHQMNMPTNAVQPQLALNQQPSLTAQQALTAASSVSTQGRDGSHDVSSGTASLGPSDSNVQHSGVASLPAQPQHQMLQLQQQQGLPVMPVGALPPVAPGAQNPLQLQFLQRGPLPAPLSDADAAAFCNRMLLSGFPLAGGMAVPALFAQQMNRQRLEGPVLAVPTPRSDGICLALACDDEQLSEYQILVRKQLEIFEAQQEDVESNTQGRKKQVVLGQVGIRCRHCSGLPLRQRGRGAVYYPAKLQGVYQAAQNMASSHLCESCQYIPHPVKQDLRVLRERRDTASGGKQYWADGARAMGLYESEDGLKLRRGPVPSDEPAVV